MAISSPFRRARNAFSRYPIVFPACFVSMVRHAEIERELEEARLAPGLCSVLAGLRGGVGEAMCQPVVPA